MSGCPFCGEPAVRTMVGGIVVYRCGTEGPYVSTDGHSEYQTGRVCDTHTYQRLLDEKDAEIERLRGDLRACRQYALAQLTDDPIDGLAIVIRTITARAAGGDDE